METGWVMGLSRDRTDERVWPGVHGDRTGEGVISRGYMETQDGL